MNEEQLAFSREELNKVITGEWSQDKMIEVSLDNPQEDFLKIIETLTRIGVSVRDEKRLVQSCHILQKKGKYYIVHFKELFILDGRQQTNFTVEDSFRRNTITKLLEEWDLLKIVNPELMLGFVPVRKIKIISHSEKKDWFLDSKYTIGNRK